MKLAIGSIALAPLLFSLVACGDSEGDADLGSTHPDAMVARDLGADAGRPADAASSDATPAQDAEPNADAEPSRDADAATNPDAEPALDAEVDAGPEDDGGAESDAASNPDAAPSLDADVDAGADGALPVDAAADAGGSPDATVDAGADGGLPGDAGVGPSICNTPPSSAMTFFVTEEGNLSGDFGGLAGADARCTAMAIAAGITGRTWVAYLSALNDATYGRVDAVDRIGAGPWYNHAGDSVGTNASIHGGTGLPAAQILTECGRLVLFDSNDFGGDPGAHDVFTGSTPQGTLQYVFANPQLGPGTCADWTSSLSTNYAYVGHTDWNPGDSWNAAHITSGCDETSLRATAANGRIYCFATD